MSRLLLIAFEPHEGPQGAGFAQALGIPFDILSLIGTADADLGAETIFAAALTEIPPADGLAQALKNVALSAQHPAPSHPVTQSPSHPVTQPPSSHYSHIAAVSSMRSKDVLARLAGLLDAAMVTDAIEADSPSIFKRPIVAGAVIATVEVLHFPVVITVRPAGFKKPTRAGSSNVESIDLGNIESKAKRMSVTARGGTRPDLTRARVVVSGGRPLKDAETFEKVIGGLADQLQGAVGATRAAVDSGIAANELQVGQTGKIVAPELYIAAGISGSTQHVAGIKDSKVIVAINKDPDAPIFEVADFGLVADLYDAIPELRDKLQGSLGL